MPHTAFRGQTPDEIYFGTGEHVPAALEAAHREARNQRLAEHRAVHCGVCVPTASPPKDAPPTSEAVRFQ